MFRPGLILLLALLATPAGADVYKWTDAQGKAHYGDQPPSTPLAKPFDPKTSKATEAQAGEARRKAADQAMHKRLEQVKAREEEAQKQAADAEEARRKAENCQRARGNLEALQRPNMRLTTVDAQGRSRALDAAARQAEIERANKMAAENCAN